jgi:hypothetical protein
MLHCKTQYAAMQTDGLLLASGMPRLVPEDDAAPLPSQKGTKMSKTAMSNTAMSKTASFGVAPSVTIFSRLMAAIDRILMAHARVAMRNGDLPYFGL